MTRLSRTRVARAFADGDAAITNKARGDALENLLVYLFTKITGVRLMAQNALTINAAGEIDLIFWNDRTTLDFLPNILMFECKNWNAHVDSAAVSFFKDKATNRHLTHAFLIASNGITGDPEQLRSAYAHLHNALVMNDCKIVLLDREELLGLGSTEQLVQLIIKKISLLYLMGV